MQGNQSSGVLIPRWLLVLFLGLLILVLLRQYNLLPGPSRLHDAQATSREPAPRGDLRGDEQTTIALFKQASPAVVNITSLAVRRDAFSLNLMEIPQGTGSGFIWNDQGHVVTNFHVVRGANSLQVTLSDRSTWSGAVVGVEPDKDVAVIKIEAPAERLTPITVGTSADLQVGQSVLAIGNPFGLDQTLTTGVISGLGREIQSTSGRPIQGVIQTDAAINPGNSGGPLLDSAGRLIGVNTAIYSPSGAYAGVGFAVPVDTVNRIVPELIRHGKIVRPGLGVSAAEDQIAQRMGIEGVLILEMDANSAAAKAGLRATKYDSQGQIRLGDVIKEVDGEPIRTNNDLYKILEKHQVGDTVQVTVDRNGDTEQFQVQLQGLNTSE